MISVNSLNGQWLGKHKNDHVILEMKRDGVCSLEFYSEVKNDLAKFNGECIIDTNKIPFSFVMTNILELNSSLYSVVKLINEEVIHISEFSTKWKLRPVAFSEENTIILKRYLLTGEENEQYSF